jgi:hypothetical protein
LAAPEDSPPDQQRATCILVLGHLLAEGRQHREVRTALGEVRGDRNDEIALVSGIEYFDARTISLFASAARLSALRE